MKATTNTTNFPSTAKLLVFAALISGLAFLSCVVSNAQASNETTFKSFLDEMNENYADVLKSSVELSGISMDQVWAARLNRALVNETEESLDVESWMLDAEFTNVITEESLEIEDWMLDPDYFYNAETYEEALEIEPWMLDTEYFIGTDADENPVELEDWMIE